MTLLLQDTRQGGHQRLAHTRQEWIQLLASEVLAMTSSGGGGRSGEDCLAVIGVLEE